MTKGFALALLILCAATNASAGQTYDIKGAKVISVEAMSYGDAYIRVVLDMSEADVDLASATASCAPTMDAWVVTMWSMSDHLEAAAFSTALAAQTLGATVDVMITSATACNTGTNFPNLAAPGSPLATSGGPVPSGLGMRFSSIKITQ